jgi:hypothetical protein
MKAEVSLLVKLVVDVGWLVQMFDQRMRDPRR